MPSTTTFSDGDIVVVRFPFTNHESTKAEYNESRPDVILLAITSRLKTPLGFGEALIDNWHNVGPLKPSAFKPIVFIVERALIGKALGRLDTNNRETLSWVLAQALFPQPGKNGC